MSETKAIEAKLLDLLATPELGWSADGPSVWLTFSDGKATLAGELSAALKAFRETRLDRNKLYQYQRAVRDLKAAEQNVIECSPGLLREFTDRDLRLPR